VARRRAPAHRFGRSGVQEAPTHLPAIAFAVVALLLPAAVSPPRGITTWPLTDTGLTNGTS